MVVKTSSTATAPDATAQPLIPLMSLSITCVSHTLKGMNQQLRLHDSQKIQAVWHQIPAQDAVHSVARAARDAAQCLRMTLTT